MTEQNLIDIGFERFDETNCEHPFYYYNLNIGGIDFISNADDEFKEDGVWVEILETDIRFHTISDLHDTIRIFELNQK